MTILAAVCVLLPLVALHEWGHYIVARLCKVKVLVYSVGMGPRLFSYTSKKSGIEYRLAALPIGGYVKMLDEREGEVLAHEKHLAFNNVHPLKKIAIVAAGPLMNFIVAIVLFFVLFLQPSEQLSTRIGKLTNPAQSSGLVVGDTIVAIDQKPVESWQDIYLALAERMGESGSVSVQARTQDDQTHSYAIPIQNFMQQENQSRDPLVILGILGWQPVIEPIIGELLPNGAGALMGLKVGDKLIFINDTPIHTWQDATQIIQQNPETMLRFQVQREGALHTIQIMPQAKKIRGENRSVGQIGAMVANHNTITIPDEYKITINRTPAQALQEAFTRTYDLSAMTVTSIGKMLSGLIGLEQLSGPIAIADMSRQSFELGIWSVLSTAALISLSLAVLNLLPIPILDGGHIVYALFEWIAGRPLSEKVQMMGLNIGMMMMLALMLVAISNDITRLFG